MAAWRPTVEHLAEYALIGMFVVAVSLPLANRLLRPAETALLQTQENRRPEPLPPLKLSRNFPAHFEAYYRDTFGFRSALIHMHNWVKVRWLGVSSSPMVLLGKDGWLFFTGQGSIEDYRGLKRFTPEELDRWQHALESRRDWLAQRGIDYLLVIVPNKQTIYPEFLPDGFGRLGPATRLEQLVAHLREHSHFRLLDLREPLLQAKAHERLYHRYDTHWNDRGAYVAYREILTALAAHGPAMRPLPRSAFAERSKDSTDGDLARMLGMQQAFHEEDLYLLPSSPRRAQPADPAVHRPEDLCTPECQPFATECPNPCLPRAVMLHDSFATRLVPFLSEHFRRIVYLRQRTFDCAVIEREHPDVVIEEICERLLCLVPPDDAALEKFIPQAERARTLP